MLGLLLQKKIISQSTKKDLVFSVKMASKNVFGIL